MYYNQRWFGQKQFRKVLFFRVWRLFLPNCLRAQSNLLAAQTTEGGLKNTQGAEDSQTWREGQTEWRFQHGQWDQKFDRKVGCNWVIYSLLHL